MSSRQVRFGLGAGAAALAVAALAGCSGSGGGSAGGNGGGGAIGPAGDAAAISLVADSINKADSANTVTVTGTTSIPGLSGAESFTAQEQFSPSLEMSLTASVGGANASEILIGDKFYMQAPTLDMILGGKQWAEVDLSKATGPLGSLSTMASSARTADPATQLSALLASGQVAEVGTETVDGQQTTHYRGTLTAAEALGDSAGTAHLSAAQLASLKQLLEQGGVSTETIDVWVASDKLPVEMRISSKTAAGTMTADLHMSHWGATLEVGAPPASETLDVTTLMSSALAGKG